MFVSTQLAYNDEINFEGMPFYQRCKLRSELSLISNRFVEEVEDIFQKQMHRGYHNFLSHILALCILS